MTKLRALSWNVNGIRAAHKKGFTDWLVKDSPDILCLQETKATEDQIPKTLKEVDGYQAYFSSPQEKKGYSGVALYTKPQPKSLSTELGIEKFDVEGRVQIADYGHFLLYNVYFPNGKASAERLQYKMEFYEAFLEQVKKLREDGRNVVICGDVNTAHREIDLARPKDNEKISGFLPEEREWIDRLLDSGFVDTFRAHHGDKKDEYSWWAQRSRARERNVGWRIDYFIANKEFMDCVTDAFILQEVEGSDHCPIGVEITLPG